jgi:hypothetical protein
MHHREVYMSVRNRFRPPLSLSATALFSLALLIACGGSSKGPNPTPTPSGSFSDSNLNGTYVFTVSGADYSNDAPYAIVGTFNANGSGSITGGVLDITDEDFSSGPLPNQPISGSSTYKVGSDGRGQATLVTSTPFSKVVLDFVLQDSSHGLVTEFDTNASGSGTLDLQTSGATLSGSYAFEFSGILVTTSGTLNSTATVGNFTLGSAGAANGLEDVNSGGIPYPAGGGAGDVMSGTVVLGPTSSPATQLVTPNFTIKYDVYAVDSNHLKFIEMDGGGTLTGDAFAQTSTTMPVGTQAFTLMGGISAPIALGGYMVTDGSGNITSASSEDVNNAGNVSTAPITFSALYTANGTGRYDLTSFSGFVDASEFAAYPSSGGLLLLEDDTSGGIMVGAANLQSSTTFSASQGYGLNLTGDFLSSSGAVEVDDIAEFTATGGTISGIVDENAPGGSSSGGPNYDLALSGNYAAPGSSGRGAISATAGNSSNSTLNGGFGLTFYTVDGTTFPFIETDSTQVASGVMVLQNPSAASTAIRRSRMMVVRPLVRPHMMRRRPAE